MGLYKRGSVWCIDFYVSGRRVRETVGQNRKLAERVLAKRKVEVAENRYLNIRKQSNISFDQMADLYMEYARANKRSWKRDEYSLKHLSDWFAGKKLRDVTSLSVEEYKVSRLERVKPGTLNRELNCLKHMFTKAVEWKKVTENPTLSVKLIRVNNIRLRFLSREECDRLVRACSDDLRPIVIVALHTGMRRGELLNLRWDDVDLGNQLIHIRDSKSGEPRKVPMSGRVFTTFATLAANGPFVFAKHNGDQRRDVRTAFANALDRAGISEFRFHDLRHTFASHLVMDGADGMNRADR